jgi:hypothetical protein
MKFDKWIDVVTDPLGLVGFALFLVFSYLAAQPKYAEVRGLRMFFGGTRYTLHSSAVGGRVKLLPTIVLYVAGPTATAC